MPGMAKRKRTGATAAICIAQPICAEVDPALESHGRDHRAACHFPGTPLTGTGTQTA